MYKFLICSIFNDILQYSQSRESFLQAGFDEEYCRYEIFDNSIENLYDPYRTIDAVLAEAKEPYVIFCHQDLLLNQGHGFDQLISQLDTLNNWDPDWALAGNAGFTEDLSPIFKISDPNGCQVHGELPHKVYSLDENFLVIRTAANLRCSQALNGFHLYAVDLCLQAAQCNLSCYVIDFHLTHLSGGNSGSEDFQRSLVRFRQKWNQSFTLSLVQTPCAFFYLSRSRIIRRMLRSGRIMGWIREHISIYIGAVRTKKRIQRDITRFLSCRHQKSLSKAGA